MTEVPEPAVPVPAPDPIEGQGNLLKHIQLPGQQTLPRQQEHLTGQDNLLTTGHRSQCSCPPCYQARSWDNIDFQMSSQQRVAHVGQGHSARTMRRARDAFFRKEAKRKKGKGKGLLTVLPLLMLIGLTGQGQGSRKQTLPCKGQGLPVAFPSKVLDTIDRKTSG